MSLNVAQAQDSNSRTMTQPTVLQTRMESGSTGPVYVGLAVPGTGDDEAGWQITKLTYDAHGPVSIMFADDVATFTKVWDDRATYTYS